MNRDTILLLAIIAAMALLLTGAVLAVADAMILSPPPEATPSVQVSGSIVSP